MQRVKRRQALKERDDKKVQEHHEVHMDDCDDLGNYRGVEVEVTVQEADAPKIDGASSNQVAMEALQLEEEQQSTKAVRTEHPCTEAEETQTEVTGKASSAFLSVEALQHDNHLLHYYTGLETFEKFQAIFQSLGEAVHHLKYLRTETVSSISPVNQFLLMLAKLRQDLGYLPLARMCGVSVFTAKNVFMTWINFCSRQWGELDTWVSQELVRFYAPSDFKEKFPTTRAIFDATEVPTEKPPNPSAQCASFSIYKNKNIVKTVVGISPGGLVSYVSAVYCATSDRQIIERSDLCDRCDPGDSVMADKGFNVQDLFAAKDVAINIPAFFKKKTRLTEKQVLDDCKVSSKRVHVEQVIGMAKTYKILVNGLTASETKLARHIIIVCFTLCNFRKNIVSTDA